MAARGALLLLAVVALADGFSGCRNVDSLSFAGRRQAFASSFASSLMAKARRSGRDEVRVDELLVSRSVVGSKDEAKALVLAGDVMVGEVGCSCDTQVKSVATMVPPDAAMRVRTRKSHPWVSRGGLKLEHSVATWGLDFKGVTAIDVGCSTGGFTDVLLHHGAKRVFAVDVGYGLLDYRLRKDPRVCVRERVNARLVNASLVALLPGEADATNADTSLTGGVEDVDIDVVVCDASFISLRQVLPPSLDLCRSGGRVVALVKPQFEAARDQIEEGGVVRDAAVREAILRDAHKWLDSLPGWSVVGSVESPITGPAGNVEYLLFGVKQ
mmetsp:Transcript_61347/g.168418  ORF Transcript_61347/g.168418 Transcript_61347/m.168418 type:complete len:327 (-) Transcript_61347:136-1116(-)